MKIIYSKEYEKKYRTNPVESPDRVRLSALELSGYEFIEPDPATIEDVLRVHGREHIDRVHYRDLLEPALYAAGGAILASKFALNGEAAFSLSRPPGHHASANRSWGLCFFNNIAIAISGIRDIVDRILVLDIDLHFGDGTSNIFRGEQNIKIVNPGSVDANFDYLNMDPDGYISQIEDALSWDFDLVAVSAGFDYYIEDWGGLLGIEDYKKIGELIKKETNSRCEGRRFAVLEGGYHKNLGHCVRSFVDGFA